MDSRYKFRGKRVDNGEWVEGWYFVSTGSLYPKPVHYIIVDKVHDRNSVYMEIAGEAFACYKVIPESVGQYTGLKDKNGVDICQGDIVEFANERGSRYQVVYDDDVASFALHNWETSIHTFFYELNNEEEIEIIGNVQDHPQLLEGK